MDLLLEEYRKLDHRGKRNFLSGIKKDEETQKKSFCDKLLSLIGDDNKPILSKQFVESRYLRSKGSLVSILQQLPPGTTLEIKEDTVSDDKAMFILKQGNQSTYGGASASSEESMMAAIAD